MTAASEELVEAARAVTIADAAARLKLTFRGRSAEHPQPCPVSGGKDRFSFNTAKNAWHCRGCGVGGKDAIGMAAHCLGLNVDRRGEFLEACSVVTGLSVPDDAERESDEDRAARQKRLEELRQQSLEEQARRQAEGDDYRERERAKARGIYDAAQWLNNPAGSPAHHYVRRRTNVALCHVETTRTDWLRTSPQVTYWHGQDELGRPLALYNGPALIAPFIDPALQLIGCHVTWIDLAVPSKFRPVLYGLTKEGAKAGLSEWRVGDAAPTSEQLSAGLYERLPTKKMRGSKKGGLIPLIGDPAAHRWVGGEGIENGVAFAGWENCRPDTFYFAAGDLGNLAGPADPKSRFAHPSLTVLDRKGRPRPVMVAGAEPKSDQDADDAMWVGDHVDELVLLGDGDSEPVFTAAAMARARKRHARPGRSIPIIWPRQGFDFSRMAAEAQSDAGAA